MKQLRQNTGPARKLLPLDLIGDDRVYGLVEKIEPTRRRHELMLDQENGARLEGLIQEFRHGDTLRRHGLTVRSKLLFCGPPGCGKTMSAEVFAGELGLPLLVCRLDAVISSFLGETASNLRKIFDLAAREPSVLFFDEFDALARSRANGAEHNELRRVVNSLLMMIDRYRGRGFLIAATNLESSIDSAIWRRFDEVLLLERPSPAQIRKFLILKMRNFPVAFNLNRKAPNLSGLSYADIERICLDSIKHALLEKRSSVVEEDFQLAAREERRRKQVQARFRSKR